MTIDRAKTIDELAVAAGFINGIVDLVGRDGFERFNALVRAQVIEQAAQVCEQMQNLEPSGRPARMTVVMDPSSEMARACAAAIRGMKSDSGHSATADAGASTAPLPEGESRPWDNVPGRCWCRTCRPPITPQDMRMVLCPDCGNKRCPKANHHDNACTNSNEPGQPGSAYPAVDWAALGRRSLAGDQKPNVQAESASPSVLLIRGEK